MVLKPCPVEGNSLWSNSSQRFDSKGLRSSSTRSTRVLSMSSACKPTPLKVFRAEMMQEQERHTHTLHAYVHAPTPACAHICIHAPCTNLCAQMHTQKHTYVRKGTCTRIYSCTHTHTYVHACTNLSTHANVYAHARTHAYIQP